MNGATTDERNYYAENYFALIEAIIKETVLRINVNIGYTFSASYNVNAIHIN